MEYAVEELPLSTGARRSSACSPRERKDGWRLRETTVARTL